ncbi:hypothetical protein Fmac_024475 [Flemingia macrophylla]|uniref:Mce/MlaD domain-containing protein n=1 Tax=Flemingia macrophylla TaxID=520843 RepID=A0ABD1LPI2_9FABA
MIRNPPLHASTLPSPLSSSLITLHGSFVNCVPCLPFKPQRKSRIRATSADAGHIEPSPPSGSKNPLLDIPHTLWRQTLRPLSDFGFGGRSIWEGGVGLKYTATFEFDQASGICTGTPVRIRGVTVGDVICVNPSLRSIEAVVEIEDDKTIIRRNSLVEVNQSGLLMETIIDITPHDPIPTPSNGPLDQECSKEGLIVCDREKIKGHQGVRLDALVGIFTRLEQDVEKIGIANSYLLAERAASIIEEARPLLTKIKAMSEDVQPLLTEVRDSNLLKEVETLT